MPEPRSLRAVETETPSPPPRRRGPGLAVLLVIAYGLAFVAALWWLRARSPLFQAARRETKSGAIPPAPARSRAALLAGEGLTGPAREEYLGGLVVQCCDCGCDLTLRVCLLSDRTCTRSPELATAILERHGDEP